MKERIALVVSILALALGVGPAHAHDHLLRAGLAQVEDPAPTKTKLHNVARAYQAAFDELAQQARLAA